MKYVIEYYDIEYGAPIFSSPKLTRKEIVDPVTIAALERYISKQTDLAGCKFKKEKIFGFNYISNQGALKVYPYKVPVIKKID